MSDAENAGAGWVGPKELEPCSASHAWRLLMRHARPSRLLAGVGEPPHTIPQLSPHLRTLFARSSPTLRKPGVVACGRRYRVADPRGMAEPSLDYSSQSRGAHPCLAEPPPETLCSTAPGRNPSTTVTSESSSPDRLHLVDVVKLLLGDVEFVLQDPPNLTLGDRVATQSASQSAVDRGRNITSRESLPGWKRLQVRAKSLNPSYLQLDPRESPRSLQHRWYLHPWAARSHRPRRGTLPTESVRSRLHLFSRAVTDTLWAVHLLRMTFFYNAPRFVDVELRLDEAVNSLYPGHASAPGPTSGSTTALNALRSSIFLAPVEHIASRSIVITFNSTTTSRTSSCPWYRYCDPVGWRVRPPRR